MEDFVDAHFSWEMAHQGELKNVELKKFWLSWVHISMRVESGVDAWKAGIDIDYMV